MLDEETAKIREQVGDEVWEAGRPEDTREIFERVALSPDLIEFLTLPGLPLSGLEAAFGSVPGTVPLGVRAQRRRPNRIADADVPVAQDVRAQAATMDERPEHGPSGVPLDDRARLAQPHAAAGDARRS